MAVFKHIELSASLRHEWKDVCKCQQSIKMYMYDSLGTTGVKSLLNFNSSLVVCVFLSGSIVVFVVQIQITSKIFAKFDAELCFLNGCRDPKTLRCFRQCSVPKKGEFITKIDEFESDDNMSYLEVMVGVFYLTRLDRQGRCPQN